MSSLIDELQRDALNPDVSVTQLLQKCLVVGSKLKIVALVNWARLELDGYKEAPIPEYRNVVGLPQIFNPARGYQQLGFVDCEQFKWYSTMPFNQPISELEHSLRRAENSGSDGFHVSYSPEVEIALRKVVRPFPMSPSLLVNASQFHKIMEAVRKAILEWALQLETAGVKGEGMSFSPEEKQRARSAIYNIATHIYGNVERSQVGTASSTQHNVNQAIDITKLSEIVATLKGTLQTLPLEPQAKLELRAEIQTLEAQAASPRPKVSIIKESLATLRNILEGIVGNLAAAAILNQIGSLRI
ncbi:MAG: hypothetical protein WB780_12820 [Candidatus Acidiferrales bacterium]